MKPKQRYDRLPSSRPLAWAAGPHTTFWSHNWGQCDFLPPSPAGLRLAGTASKPARRRRDAVAEARWGGGAGALVFVV